MDKIKNIYIKQ